MGLAVTWTTIIVTVSLLLGVGDPASSQSQLLGSTSILVAILFSLVTSLAAARRDARSRLGWSILAVALALGALGQVNWVVTALSDKATTPSAVGDALGFLGYVIPMIAAIFAFPRRSELLISRFRQVLDVLVITIGVLVISESTVLGAVLQQTSTESLAGILHLGYLVADVMICALVLCLGMRQLPGDRLTWLFVGGGVLTFAVTDSIYVGLLAAGATNVTATPLAAGWMIGPVLVGLATFIPMTGRISRGRDFTLVLHLVPYLPVGGALVTLLLRSGEPTPLVLVTSGLLLLTVAVRQVMIVYENVSLTRDLEAKVASRTMELTALGSIVTSSSDAIVGISRDDRITSWNPAATRLYGHAADAVVGRSPEFLLAQTGSSTMDLLKRADAGETFDVHEITWKRPDGSEVPVAMTISPIVGTEGIQGISVFAQDITQRRREAKALEQAREDALATSRLKSDFLATMSHEIRTPMNAVIGLTSLLLEGELDPVQRMYAEGVQSAGDALLTVIDDILDFSKLEAGKVVLDRSDFSPRRLVEEVGALMAPAASAKGLELIAYCLPGMPAAVHGDAGRIRQILLNLASNAVKFTPAGEVIIKADAFDAERDRVRLRFEVTDTGIGIAEHDRGRLFESFSQADASTTRRFGGTGLGLAISRRLVEVMGGTIAMDSELDVGSTFSVELPLRTASRVEPGIDTLSDDLLMGLRVLVMDDNATNRTLLHNQLDAWGMVADTVETADAAFETMRAAALAGRPYDIAALDAHLPGTDGLELAQRVSGDPVLEGSAMIMLTSSLQPEPRAMRAAGIGQWMPKPVRSAELFDRLMRLVGPREPELAVRRGYRADRVSDQQARGAVLVVNHQPETQSLIRDQVARLGFDVQGASSGASAVDLVRSGRYDLILMDLDLPGMDGFDAARQIRQLGGAEGATPIVALAKHLTAEEREHCLALDIDHVVFRPVDKDALEAVLWAMSPLVPGSQGSAPDDSSVDTVIDQTRLADLAELTAPDGTNLMVSMVESYNRRSSQRAEALHEAMEDEDQEAIAAIAHELKGAAGTIGAERVMRCAAAIELQARSGAVPDQGLVSELLTEMDEAVAELTVLIAQPDEPAGIGHAVDEADVLNG